MEPILTQSLKDQIAAGIEFNYLHDLNVSEAAEVIEIKDENGKKFKDFKKEFFNNFEKIVAPVFYQFQTKFSDKLPEAEIKSEINENKSVFSISQENIKSELIITYPAYIKAIIDINHYENNNPPIVRRLTYDIEELSEEKLSSLLNTVVNEFTNNLSLNKIYTPE